MSPAPSSTTKPPAARAATAPAPIARTRLLRLGPLSVRIHTRAAWVCGTLAAIALGIGIISLTLGDYPLSMREVVRALLVPSDDPARYIVVDLRLPRILMAILLGAALGVSGAVFQSITRNPLGSPDIIGFTTGAYTGALVVMLVIGSVSIAAQSAGALIGGIGTALLVYLLAYRGGVQGLRLVVVGIAVSAMLTAVNSFLIIRANQGAAMSAAAWGAGSLNSVDWTQAGPACVTIAVLTLPMAWLAPKMALLEMGDDTSRGLGLRAESTRLALVVVGVAFAAVAVAVAGPIAFVALAAPQLARRLTRSAGVKAGSAALMGAVLLAASDLIAQGAFGTTKLPVGVVTVCLGGAYLVWLLWREARR